MENECLFTILLHYSKFGIYILKTDNLFQCEV